MKIYKIPLLLFLLIFCYIHTYSADVTKQIDSLEKKLKSAKAEEELSILNQLADKYRALSPDKSLDIANEALEKAKKQNNEKEQANALNNLGKSSVVSEKYEEALTYFHASFKLSDKLKFVEGISKSLNNICYAYGKLKNFDKLVEYHQKAIKIFHELANYEELGNFYLSFGDAYRKASQLDKARENYDLALQNFQKVKNKEKIAATSDNLASIYIDRSDYKKAIDYLNSSLTIRKEIGDKKKIIFTQSILGQAYTLQDNLEKAISYYLSNRKISEEINFEPGIANSLNCIAPIYIKLNQHEKAIEYFEEALGIYEKINPSGSEYASCLNNLANVYKELNDHTKSVEYYKKALRILENSSAKNTDIATLLLNIGDEYEKTENYQEALKYFQKAIKLQEEVGNQEGMANSLCHIGTIKIYMNNPAAALEDFNKSQAIAEEIKSSALVLSNLQKKADAYKAMGNMEKSIECLNQYIQNKEILYNEQMSGKVAEMQTQFDTDKKQHQIELMQKESEVQDAKLARQRLIIIASLIGLLTFLITIFFVWNRYRLKKKSHAALEIRNQQIMQQKEEIEAQKDEIEHQKELIEEKNQEVMDSIRYAKRIQAAVLPNQEFLSSLSHDHFILLKPKDIVSGDFYWMTKRKQWTIVVAADCTGHGVPGAFMSMLGVSFLNEIVSKEHIYHAGHALDELRKYVVKSLQQKGISGEQKDGMDIVFVAINEETLTLEYAGANNPLYHVRNSELTEYKADKMPIAIYLEMNPFTNHEIQLEKGDTLYMSSDGFEDQFGGPKGKKFMAKQFKQMIVANQDKSMEEQGQLYDKAIEDWKAFTDPVTGAPFAQIDDILVVGLKI